MKSEIDLINFEILIMPLPLQHHNTPICLPSRGNLPVNMKLSSMRMALYTMTIAVIFSACLHANGEYLLTLATLAAFGHSYIVHDVATILDGTAWGPQEQLR